MNIRSHYQLTPAFQKRAAHEMFFDVILRRKWMGVVGFGIAGCICLAMTPTVPWVFSLVFLGLALYLLFVWGRGYWMLRKQAVALVQSLRDQEVSVEVDEECLRVVMDGGVREIKWSEVDEVVESKSCLILVVGKQPAVCLPLDLFSTEEVDEFDRLASL
tara:strand:+ start:4353 stop:4832 length:480 start_codon:yes stop_codon:yes gene_type:complete